MNEVVRKLNDYSTQTVILVLTWAAALIFALAGLTSMFFGFQGYCHIEDCPVKVYPMWNAAADIAADAGNAEGNSDLDEDFAKYAKCPRDTLQR